MSEGVKRPFSEPRWSAAQARRELEAWRASGLSQQRWCKQRGVSLSRLRYWTAEEQRSDGFQTDRLDSVVRLSLKGAASPTSTSPTLELEVEGRYRVRVPVGFDAQTLERLLTVLAC